MVDDDVFVVIDPRNLPLKFGHNRVSDRCNIVFAFVVTVVVVDPRNPPLGLVKIRSETAEISLLLLLLLLMLLIPEIYI